jgi:hypothetical protein
MLGAVSAQRNDGGTVLDWNRLTVDLGNDDVGCATVRIPDRNLVTSRFVGQPVRK